MRLSGKTVLLTRRLDDVVILRRRLHELGAQVVVVPSLIENWLLDHPNWQHIAADGRNIAWLVCCSRLAAEGFQRGLAQRQQSLAATVQLAAVGPATAVLMERMWQRQVDVVAQPATANHLAAALLAATNAQTAMMVLPVGNRSRSVVATSLQDGGRQVLWLPVYQTVYNTDTTPAVPAVLDFIVFCSPSSVESWLLRQPLPAATKIVTIGPTTSAAVHRHGGVVWQQAPTPSDAGLLAALLHED